MMTTDEQSKRINKYIQESGIAAKYLSAVNGIELKDDDITRALLDSFRIDDGSELILKDLDNLKIITILMKYDFRKMKPELIETLELEKAILPDGIFGPLNEEKIKNNNEIWKINKNDADPFPHSIHAHNYEANIKLDLRDGKLYRKREEVGAIRKKELEEIRGKVRNIVLPGMTI